MNLELVFFSAFAGLFASISPCTLPVYPVILNMLSKGGTDRRTIVLAFTAGLAAMFMLFYTALAAGIKWVGATIMSEQLVVIYATAHAVAALVCILFALQSLGKLNVFGRTFGIISQMRPGILGSFLTGALFATVVSPCNLPFLIVGIYPLLVAKTTAIEGAALMLLFSLSMCLPLLFTGLLSKWAIEKHLKPHVREIELFSAAFLLVAAAYFLYLTAASF